MQIISTSPKTAYTPNFQRNLKLPTKDVICCITGNIPEPGSARSISMLKTIRRIFKLNMKNLNKIPETPLAYELYIIGAGNLMKKENQKLKILADSLKKLPQEEKIFKIKQVVNEVGDSISVKL